MPYLFNEARILVFSKAPIPGQVKTRLCPPLTHQDAAQIHQQLTTNTLKMACEETICPIQLWCSPSPTHKFFTLLKEKFPITLEQQVGNNLGEKMHHASTHPLNQRNLSFSLAQTHLPFLLQL